MRYLSLLEVLELHEMIISSSGGSYGIRDIKALESAINQPRITFDQTDLYPDIISKASALCIFLGMNPNWNFAVPNSSRLCKYYP